LSQAVLAVTDVLRLIVGREHDVYDLPVAFMRLPEQTARCERVRVDVVVVKVPVLEHGHFAVVDNMAVDDRAAAPSVPGCGITAEPAQQRRRRARLLVQPPDPASRTGEIPGVGIRISDSPFASGELLQL
jgi:hypothetical protein